MTGCAPLILRTLAVGGAIQGPGCPASAPAAPALVDQVRELRSSGGVVALLARAGALWARTVSARVQVVFGNGRVAALARRGLRLCEVSFLVSSGLVVVVQRFLNYRQQSKSQVDHLL